MSDRPTYSTPNGATVAVTIPPGWFTYVSGLARKKINQMVRMQVSNSSNPNVVNADDFVYYPTRKTETNATMRLSSNYYDSHQIKARKDTQRLELTAYYSKDKLEDEDLVTSNSVVKGLRICQAETPEHLMEFYPDHITYFVFIQASPDQQETENAPLYNDAVCTINLIKGTGLNNDGDDMIYEGNAVHVNPNGNNGSGITGGNTTGGSTTGGGITGGGATDGDLSDTALDIVFVQDCTGSQQEYIKASIDSIINISTKIASSAKLAHNALRLRLIGFRDAGDPEYVTKPFAFTHDVSVMRSNLSTLVANGGGDGPEAVAEALDAALVSDWRADATKLVILITDAPPHGIGEPSDKSPAGGKEPLKIVRRMAELGITLHLVACEPTLSTYQYAYDFYKALTKITGGLVLPLVSASKLADYIIGSSLERVELDTLIANHGNKIAERALFKQESQEALTKEYHAKFLSAGVTLTTLEIEPVYAEYAEGLKNVETYYKATGVAAARPLLQVPGARLLPKFANGSASPTVNLAKKPISKEQTARVVTLAITQNADLSPSGNPLARPTHQDPVKNSFKINIPAGWYVFVSALSRAKYNQTVKLFSTQVNNQKTEFLLSEGKETDEAMSLSRSSERFYTFAAHKKHSTVLETSFFWSKQAKGEALNDDQYASQKLKSIQTQTPPHTVGTFPDYVTYFIMAEDQAEADQVAGVPDFNDCVGVVNLIKKNLMVFDDRD